MKIKEKEKRRRLLEKSSAEPTAKLSKAAAAEKLRQLTKAGKASLLKVRQQGLAGPLGGAWPDGDHCSLGGRAGGTARLWVLGPLVTGTQRSLCSTQRFALLPLPFSSRAPAASHAWTASVLAG